MKIKQKLYVLGFAAIVGIVVLIGANKQFSSQTRELAHARVLVDRLEIRLLNLRRNEKDFLLRESSKYLDTFKQNRDLFLTLEQELASILDSHKLSSSSKLRSDLIAYSEGFEKLVAAKETLGLSSESGMLAKYNQLLNSAIEAANSEQKLALIQLDDAVSQGNFASESNIQQFSTLLEQAKAVVAQRNVIGVEYNKGLMGNARGFSHTVEEQFSSFSTLLNNEILKEQHYLNRIETGISIIVIVVILGFIFQISRTINSSVTRLLSVIENISSTNNVGLRVSLNGNDELSSIGKYFNQLLDKIEALIKNSQIKSRELSSSTVKMHGETEGVISQFHVQAEHTDMMATSVQEMVSTIGEISESTNVAVEGVQQAAKNASQGRAVVETTLKNIDQLSHRLQTSQASISSLNEFVEQIGGAVTIIQGIAEQTNLLALNAAIEAARAGEQGRGFAVVADEVRSLATRTHKSTEDITKVVCSIQTQMNTVVSEIELCTEQGRETQSDSEILDESLQQIISDMHEIQSNSERIAAAIEEQGIVMNQVSESITELNSISENNMNSAKEVLIEIDQVSGQAKEMDRAVSEFKTN
ncbi:methyl-accepting chemotaxis protein [Vibrio viridaestus]|uniref:Methyl-accepting chemotaxis protein n=1 Tax=Vibrio viridaestus TaxID=2487322 RepID=A0A3N9U2G3_9VIBR|nr:HAMP domain-containing methyl-accepting chemotaxis protein [Vibrio viridaestus]RQW62116.1 methyl-accepting chemotaxis protein [Vibrio viridaestus]